MIAMQFPLYAVLSVSLAPAEYTRALMGTQLRHRMTYVCLLGHHKTCLVVSFLLERSTLELLTRVAWRSSFCFV